MKLDYDIIWKRKLSKKEGSIIIFFLTDYADASGYVYYSDNAVFEFMKDCVWIEITERKLVGGTDA